MTMAKKPWERLDALLSALEEDDLRSEEAGWITGAGESGAEAQETQAVIESAIRARLASVARSADAPRRGNAEARGVGAKVTEALERLGQWAGIRKGRRVAGALSEVRMAFSGERKRKRGHSERRPAQDHRGEDSEGSGNGDER